MITDMDIMRAHRRLAAVFKAPEDRQAVLEAWRYVLGEYDPEELLFAVSEYLRGEHSYFPKPGKLRAVILAKRRESGAVPKSSGRWRPGDGPCPVCGADLEVLPPDHQVLIVRTEGGLKNVQIAGTGPVFDILHDLDAHDAAGQPAVGPYGFRRAREGVIA